MAFRRILTMASALCLSVGYVIRQLRSAAGYSQEGFAAAIGVHRTYMGTLERGEANPTLKKLEAVAGGLHISVSALLLDAETACASGIIAPDLARDGSRGSISRRAGRRPRARRTA